MKQVNKKRKPRKKLSTAVVLILILMFSTVFIGFGICVGFLINAFINYSSSDIIANLFLTLLVGILYMVLLLALIRNVDNENIQPIKWYVNCILISLILTIVIAAVTVFTLGVEEDNNINYLVGFCMFPLIGIITTVNIVNYVKKDTTKWKKIFYKNGNLHKIKESDEYYKVTTPVSFEKKILSVLYKEQLKNILVVIGFMVMTTGATIHYIMRDHSYSGKVISDLIELKSKRLFGFMFFLMIFFMAFCIPIIAFYINNALKKIRVVKNHEYIAYHAIIPGVHNGRIGINNKNRHYAYKYCTCVGIKEKDVHFTPMTLIFVPDDVLLFPDSEDYKIDRKK